jgi:hypothetical protein
LVSYFYVFSEISWFFCEEEKKHFFQKVPKVPKKSKNHQKISQFDDQNRQKVDPKKEKIEKKS